MSLGQALNDNLVSIATTLDHCHVPGRADHAQLDEKSIEIGTGPHNEPGYIKVSPQPSAEELIKTLIKYLTDESDPERGYVHFSNGDEVALLINNFGGMSVLEMGALADEFVTQLPPHLKATRIFTGPFETSLNAPAFSLTICNLSAAAKATKLAVPDLLQLIDSKTESAWEALAGAQSGKRRERNEQIAETPVEDKARVDASRDVKLDPVILERSLKKACERVIAAEPDLTRWDTVMGDGDCGETFKTGASELFAELNKGLANDGSVLKVLHAVSDITETKMGGTLGAVLSIFFNALAREIAETQDLLTAPLGAVQSLEKHTPARPGHRTIMDSLTPAAEALQKEGLKGMYEAARKGAESTRGMGATLGRATYVGGKEDSGDVPPDPGAWGAMEIIQGLLEGVEAR
jgi:dihydroxyacetone kinase